MIKNILVTGSPGCGKTTLIKRVVTQVRSPVGGFYTEEIREEGSRRGFKLVTLDGQEGLLAHDAWSGPPRVGKYGVDLKALESVGVAAIQRGLRDHALVVIDEIGPMEMFSSTFCRVVLEALSGEGVILGSIVRRSKPFSDQIKIRPDVRVIEVTPGNREALVEPMLALLRATGRCEIA